MKYDYLDAVKDDVRGYINNEINLAELVDDRKGLEEQLNDDLWADDGVTGNGSGSYTFSTYTAEQYLSHNWDLLQEALSELGGSDINILDKGAEWCDVAIRCYLLGQAISDVLDEIEDEQGEIY